MPKIKRQFLPTHKPADIINVRFEVFTALKISVLNLLGCDAMWTFICSYQRFGKHTSSILRPDDRGSTFLRNVGINLQVRTAL